MRVNYEQWLKKHSVRIMQHFISPKLFKSTEFSFPNKSTYHYVANVKDKIQIPNPNIQYLSYKNRIPLINIGAHIAPEGNPKLRIKNSASVISKYKPRYKGFKFIQQGKSFTVTPMLPIVYNYGFLGGIYKYPVTKFTDYYRWRNVKSTMVNTINRVTAAQERKQYIFVGVPDLLPDVVTLNKHANKEVSINMLSQLPTDRHLTILDVWKWFDIESRDRSLLGKINPKYLQDVLMVIHKNGIWTVINLAVLNEMIAKDDEPGGLNYKVLRKLFLALLVTVNKAATVGIDPEVDGSDSKTDLEHDGGNQNKTNTLITKGVTADTVPVSNVVKEIDDDDTEGNTLSNDEIIRLADEELTAGIIVQDAESDTTVDTTGLLTAKSSIDRAKHNIDHNVSMGTLTKTEGSKLIAIVDKQKNTTSPYKDGTTVGDAVDLDLKLLDIGDDVLMDDVDSVLDKTMLQTTHKQLNANYINNIMNKDIISSIYSIQNAGVLVHNYEINDNTSVLGDFEEHAITVKPINGPVSTLRFKIPKVSEDGEYKISGNTYVMRKQRNDYPIRKIAYNQVGLSSYYGKLFVTRSKFKKTDVSYWVLKQMIKRYNVKDSAISQLILISASESYAKLPAAYSLFARQITSITINGDVFSYSYSSRDKLLPEALKLNAIEKNGKYILVGKRSNGDPIVVDYDGIYYNVVNGKYILTEGPLELLDINVNLRKPDTVTIKIFNGEVPIVFVLLYYLGFDALAKELKLDYRSIEANKRYTPTDNEYVIALKDVKLIFTRDNPINNIIYSGLSYYPNIKEHNLSSLAASSGISNILTSNKISVFILNELDLVRDMFIDPVTKSILELNNEPGTFTGLLLKSCDLLKDDYYKDQQDLTEMVIKGYERFSGIIYKELLTALREHKNKSLFGKFKVTLDPFAIWGTINTDSSKVLVDDLNPVAVLKQSEDVTYLGVGGRAQESIGKRIRQYHSSDIGIMSEATKDSSYVGVNAYLSANPQIVNLRGEIDKSGVDKNVSFTNILSTSAMLAPGAIHDDVKRTNFISIQNSHIIPIVGKEAPYVRTGYESVIAYRLSSQYITTANDDGVVVTISKTKIVVKYNTGEKASYKLGKTKTRDSNKIAYVNELVTDLVVNSTFKKNDVIVYNSYYFVKDIFDPTKVVYAVSKNLTVAMAETSSTYEDSSALSSRIAGELATETYKIKSVLLKVDQTVSEFKHIGTNVTTNSTLLNISNIDSSINEILDKSSADIVTRLNNTAPKAKSEGVIEKIKIVYNSDMDSMSVSIRELITKYDNILKKDENNSKLTGKVTSEYSVDGTPLVNGMVNVLFYIRVNEGMGVGDKAIFANQLKTTIGEVFNDDIKSADGIDIDAMFGERSVQARVVNSPKQIGTTATLLKVIAKKAIDAYSA